MCNKRLLTYFHLSFFLCVLLLIILCDMIGIATCLQSVGKFKCTYRYRYQNIPVSIGLFFVACVFKQ